MLRARKKPTAPISGPTPPFLRLYPNPFVNEVSVEATAEGDAGNRSAGLPGLEGLGVGTALWLHEIRALAARR